MDGLREYQRRRLDLADMIRAVLHIARGYGDDEREQEARQLLARLAGDRFRLAVAGCGPGRPAAGRAGRRRKL